MIESPQQPIKSLPQRAAIDLLPYLINRLTSKSNQLWLQTLRPHGLTIPRWQVLSVLNAMDGSRVGELAEMAGAEQAVLSRVVDQMERDGLVRRRPSVQDSRVIEVWLTSKGRKLFERLMPQAGAHVDRMIVGFSRAEAAQLAADLERMLKTVTDIV